MSSITDKFGTAFVACRNEIVIDSKVKSTNFSYITVLAVNSIFYFDVILYYSLEEVNIAISTDLCSIVVTVAVVLWTISTIYTYQIVTGLHTLYCLTHSKWVSRPRLYAIDCSTILACIRLMTSSFSFAIPSFILTFAKVGINKHLADVCTRNITFINSKSQPLVDTDNLLLNQRVGHFVLFYNIYSILLEVCHQLVAIFTLYVIMFFQIGLCFLNLISILLIYLNTCVKLSLAYINFIKGICQTIEICHTIQCTDLFLHIFYCSSISNGIFCLCSIELIDLIDYVRQRFCIGCHILASSINDGSVCRISNGVSINLQILIE